MRVLRPGTLLRIEGAVALALAILLYQRDGAGWLLFALLLLVPDISMAGYLAGPRFGAAAYNLFHTYALALPLAGFGLLADSAPATTIGLIWLAHIAMDRLLGYGLKYGTYFKDTHLSRLSN